jgi:hypothetical protein
MLRLDLWVMLGLGGLLGLFILTRRDRALWGGGPASALRAYVAVLFCRREVP